MSALSSYHVKLLSQILHSTSKTLGRPSKLASQREMLSHLLGFKDWNSVCALLPDCISDTIHVGIALLEVPSADPKSFMCTGIDAPWRLPEKVRDHLIKESLNPIGHTVASYSRPDPLPEATPRYWYYDFSPTVGVTTEHKVALDPHELDYSFLDHTPTVMTFSDTRGRDAFKLTVWLITLHPGTVKATNFSGAALMPLYNTIIESITGFSPELRQAYCLVSSRHDGFDHAIVRCNEKGKELEVVKDLPYLPNDELWAQLTPYNKVLGLSLRDVADITRACVYADDEIGDGW